MNIPKVTLFNSSELTAQKIISAAKKKTSISEQINMADFYTYLKSAKNIKNEEKLNNKLLFGK